MRVFLAVFLVGWTLFAADGVREGRRGNDRYRAGAYAAAARAYQHGLAERDPQATAPLTTALWNNLGLALHRADSTQKAFAAFQNAFATAPAAAGRGRAAYDAGTAAAQAHRPTAALGRLRQALLADPSRDDARFNFEVVKRRLERKKKQQKKKKKNPRKRPDLQPSPFAKKLKARADSLVSKHHYEKAYRLLEQGMQRDSTVRAFRPFIQRTGTIAQIDTLAADST